MKTIPAITITLRQDTAVRRLIEAALDHRKPSRELVVALNKALVAFDHECALSRV